MCTRLADNFIVYFDANNNCSIRIHVMFRVDTVCNLYVCFANDHLRTQLYLLRHRQSLFLFPLHLFFYFFIQPPLPEKKHYIHIHTCNHI